MTFVPGRGVPNNVVLIGQRPGLASTLRPGLVDGRAGYRTWPAGLARWKAGASGYAVAPLTAPLVLTAAIPALALLFLDFCLSLFATSDEVARVLMAVGVHNPQQSEVIGQEKEHFHVKHL